MSWIFYRRVEAGTVADQALSYRVPIADLGFGTYNYTIIITDGISILGHTSIVHLVEGTANDANPWIAILALPLVISSVPVVVFGVWFVVERYRD